MKNYKALQQEYIFWLDTLGFAQKTITNYGFRVNDFFKWLNTQNITTINLLNQKHITTFFEYQETRTDSKFKGRLSASYLNDYFIAIDKFLEFLHQMGATNTPSPTNHRITIDNDNRVRYNTTFYHRRNKAFASPNKPPLPKLRLQTQRTKTTTITACFCAFLRLWSTIK